LIFRETTLPGAALIELERHEDHRGYNARAWCKREMEAAGLTAEIAQINAIANPRRGTLRGMHFQRPPHAESKLVRVTRGHLFDVIVDLRPESPTFLEWEGFHLRAEENKTVYVPEGFAHGCLSLADDTEFTYIVTAFYTPGAEGGFSHADPEVGIEWPAEVLHISEKDRSWGPLDRESLGAAEAVGA
jgi:dTDP-4-dehydrorhamnose 3,5-epimerase